MDRWLKAALDYIPQWLSYQMRQSEQPGCAIAIAERGRVVLEQAFGHANLLKGEILTPRHRFRVASHSKSFTAAGVMKLREQKRLRLDDTAGQYVSGLHPKIAEVTIAQLLSHSAGIVRDGTDLGQWMDRRPFRNANELKADLKATPTLEANTRFKYSNHGYGLVGQIIEQVTDEAYTSWIKREIIDAAGLKETLPDIILSKSKPLARGHSSKLMLGRRVIIPGENPTHALAPATGFVSTAADLARFFYQLSPKAKKSVISVASRREMLRRHWRDPYSSIESYYGFGVASGTLNGWDWFGHGGGFQGYITRTAVIPAKEISISVLTNSAIGFSGMWLDGIIHILHCFTTHGAPSRKTKDWAGRWWRHEGATDFLPVGNKVIVASPGFINPVMNASELSILNRDHAHIALAGGFASHGEPVRRVRNKNGRVQEIWFAGYQMLPEAKVTKELTQRYDGPQKPKSRNKSNI